MLADEYAAKLGKEIKFVTYEGGQSLDGGSSSFRDAYYAAQADPQMYEAYRDLMQGFYDLGGDLFMHFTLVSQNQPSGSWGALQYMTQTPANAPKYRALVDATTGALYRPKVRIEAVDPLASEHGAGKAVFRVTRMGDRGTAMDVTYQASGTAAYGTDYATLNAVHFEPGEESKLIEITPADDGEIEDSETVILTLTGGGHGGGVRHRRPAQRRPGLHRRRRRLRVRRPQRPQRLVRVRLHQRVEPRGPQRRRRRRGEGLQLAGDGPRRGAFRLVGRLGRPRRRRGQDVQPGAARRPEGPRGTG